MQTNKIKYTRIYLWRHPEVMGVGDGLFYGHTDIGLSRQGKSQAKKVVKRMSQEKLGGVYASDLSRARVVAEAVARKQSPRRKVQTMPELRELNLGQWEGLNYKQIADRYPVELKARYADLANFRIAGGESLIDLAERVIPAFLQIVGEHEGESVCVVGHAGVNRVILAKLMGVPLDRVFRLEQEYACLNVIDVYSDGTPVIKRLNAPVIEEEDED
ncbi:MAG: histidine phosphatase family protein [Pseudomonadota bacterium]